MDESTATPEPTAASESARISWARLLVTVGGLGLAAYLVVAHGWSDVASALQSVGAAGLAAITLYHAVPTLLCGLAWWVLLRPHVREDWRLFAWLRWIRDGTDGVVPVLPAAGEFVATRILRLRGTPFAGAGIIVDLTAELLGQLLFAMLGFALLFEMHPASRYLPWIALGIAIMTVQFVGFLVAQKRGFFRLVQRPLDWLKRRARAPESQADRTLQDQILRLHAHRGAFLGSLVLHLIAWVVGAMEAWIGLRLMGHPLTVPQVLVIESLMAATRSFTFFIPLDAGVQEGAYVLVGSLVGLPAGLALAVSLLKRARDVVKGLPALLAWQLIERRKIRRAAAAIN